jgi:large subunit ribosomal protein L21
MEYAIIESGGKQYKAVPGQTIEVDKLTGDVGEKIVLDSVLLVSDGKKTQVGQPTLKGAKVETTVVAQFKAPKIVVFKYKPRNRYRVKSGHRQQYTRLKVEGIKTK